MLIKVIYSMLLLNQNFLYEINSVVIVKKPFVIWPDKPESENISVFNSDSKNSMIFLHSPFPSVIVCCLSVVTLRNVIFLDNLNNNDYNSQRFYFENLGTSWSHYRLLFIAADSVVNFYQHLHKYFIKTSGWKSFHFVILL